MFHVQTEEEKHEYNLLKKLLKYADHYLKKFMPDKEFKDSILTENPCFEKLHENSFIRCVWMCYQEFGLTYRR